MINQFSRTELLIGGDKAAVLAKARVIVFGVGGVGGYTVEALARAGIGRLEFVDSDTVSLTNLNRQILALHSTLGMKKTDVALERVLDINPDCGAVAHDLFYTAENAEIFDLSEYDYVVDAIDTVSSKLLLAEKCTASAVPIVSSMGTGNKSDPSLFRLADIFETSGCPLARVMRRELRKRGIKKLTVVYSPEEPIKAAAQSEEVTSKRSVPGTLSYVPGAAGLILAGKVISDLAGMGI
ncbi:MAG: ThiF family adenylyltransferase [Oscillospiraceae bacterium]